MVIDMVAVDSNDDHVRFGRTRLRSSILRDILSIVWVIRSKIDLMVLSLLSAVPILVESHCNPSSSPVMVRKLSKL